MNSKKQIKYHCELHFGVSKLNNSSLVNHFFPEDLPEDWRFSYYASEFDLLLIHLSDLNLSSSVIKKGNNVLADKIAEQLTELTDDIEKSVFCIFDYSGLSAVIQQQLFESRFAAEDNCYFINWDKLSEGQLTSHSMQLEWGNVLVKGGIEETSNSDLFCHIKSEIKIEPAALRILIEHIRDHALAKEAQTMSIVFSSKHALENCRNAILLESLM